MPVKSIPARCVDVSMCLFGGGPGSSTTRCYGFGILQWPNAPSVSDTKDCTVRARDHGRVVVPSAAHESAPSLAALFCIWS